MQQCKLISTLALIASAAVNCNLQAATVVNASIDNINQYSVIDNQTNLLSSQNPNQLMKKYTRTDKAGNTHTRYQLMYNHLPVLNRDVILHKKNNQLQKVTGKLVLDIEKDTPSVNLATTNPKLILSNVKATYLKQINLTSDNAVIKNETTKLGYYLDKTNTAHLVYSINFFVDHKQGNQPSRPFFIVDANSGKVLKHWEGLSFDKEGTGPGGNEKIGEYQYGKDYDKLDVDINGNTCVFDSPKVQTVNFDGGYSGDGDFSFPCFNQNSDAINGAYSPLNDAHYFGGVIFDMYREWYNTAPLTFKLTMNVHYGQDYENAFWDGTSMTFGDGGSGPYGMFYPLVSLDVAAHEVSHGFTEQHSGLDYYGEPGGMNEAFSDIAGKAAEYYMRGKNTWGIGEDITKGSEPLRYMIDPTMDGMSIGDVHDMDDYLDVHYSSGIYNKFFYYFATAAGWNTHTAFDVMVGANSDYWQADSSFVEAAEGVMNAADDLNKDKTAIVNAFSQVGITCNPSNNSCTS